MRQNLIAVLLLAICPLLVAQQSLNNDSVIKLVKAGLSEDLIVTTINASPGTYDTSADGLIALKTAGVSDKVVAAIVSKAAATAQPAQPPVPPLPPMPGAAQQAPVGSKMSMLEPSVYSQGKTGGLFATAMTYGIAKASVKAVIRNAHSNVRVTDPNAVFYFFFEIQNAGLSEAQRPFGGTSTPNEYTLLRFDVKKDTRETTTGTFNAYGAKSGTDDKNMAAFTYAKIRPGVYKVTLSAPLAKGEYGFVSPSGGLVVGSMIGTASVSGTSRVFDFGMN